MASLDSPYIVSYLDSFIDEAQINIVLEYCPMGDLNLVIANRKKNNPFNENIIWKIFINLCLGLQYLHSKNIIHRDIKSMNIFMIKEGFGKIGDLGCSVQQEQQPPELLSIQEEEGVIINHTEVEQRVSTLRVPDLVLSDLSSDSNLRSANKDDDLLLNQNPFDIADSRLEELELGGDLLSKEDTDLLALST